MLRGGKRKRPWVGQPWACPKTPTIRDGRDAWNFTETGSPEALQEYLGPAFSREKPGRFESEVNAIVESAKQRKLAEIERRGKLGS